MNRIQLLIDDDGNRAAVRELLEARYDVDAEQPVGDADLYLVDDRSFHSHRATLRDRVDESGPVFCPVVLIRRTDRTPRISLPEPDERDSPPLVDDIVDAPIDRPLLFRRLDSLLARRTQSKELRRYVTRLEESNRSLEQFAYAASHDLQEPLRMVSSYLQLIERRYEQELDEDGEEFLEFAVDGADRMRDMIDGLLEYSRVDIEGDPLASTDLNAVLEDVLADLQMRIEDQNARITVEELPRVEGDADQLRQLFQNLLSNAIKYSDGDRPNVRVTAERTGAKWRLSVDDDGVGIPPEEQDRIFEVFKRLHSREEREGTGIGLALCKRIVERHDGRIWVDAEPGEGSTFVFVLPAVDADGDAASDGCPTDADA